MDGTSDMRGTLALAPGVLEDPDSDSLKVNDGVGNPFEIAAVIEQQRPRPAGRVRVWSSL